MPSPSGNNGVPLEDCLEETGLLLNPEELDSTHMAAETSSVSSETSGSLCRICFDSNELDLIAPCKCRGSQKHVHRSCLDNWRSAKKGFAFAHCFDCRSCYKLRPNIPPDRSQRKFKFHVAVFLHHLFLFSIVQMIVIFVAYLSLHFFKEEIRDALGFVNDHYFYATIVPLFIFIGLVYGFFILLIFNESINDFHFHLVGQQDITKEFVVEDLAEGEEVNSLNGLNEEHINELKYLGLV